jgi:hypothetical protein
MAKDPDGYLRPLQAVAETLVCHVGEIEHQEQILRDWAPFLQPFEGGVALLNETGVAVATAPGHEERKGRDYSFRDYLQTTRPAGVQPSLRCSRNSLLARMQWSSPRRCCTTVTT